MAITGNLWPGVHLQPPDSRSSRVSPLRTDVAAFLGFASRGPLHRPIAVRSLRQFLTIFGGNSSQGFLTDTVRGFFDNGGERCWIIRIDDESRAGTAAISTTTDSTNGKPLLTISASSPGSWGNGLSVRLQRTRGTQTEVVPDSESPQGWSRLKSVAGFEAGTQVVLHQKDCTAVMAVQQVDAARRFVRWTEPLPVQFDRTIPAAVESLQYSISIFLGGRYQGGSEKLSLQSSSSRYIASLYSDPWISTASWLRENADAAPPLITITQHRVPDSAELDNVSGLYRLMNGADALETVTLEDFCGDTPDGALSSEDPRSARGLQSLTGLREVSMVAIPDLHVQPVTFNQSRIVAAPAEPELCCCHQPEAKPTETFTAVESRPSRAFSTAEIALIQQRLLADCERSGRRFAILDPPFEIGVTTNGSFRDVLDYRSQFDSSYGALYYPWLRLSDPVRGGSRLVPSCGFVAGLAARMDLTQGVHRSPANVELSGPVGVAATFGDSEHAILNPAGVNLIRSCSGRGVRVMGARTLSSDSSYRFVAVRRLMMMIKTAMELGTQWAVFEPANDMTRARLKLSIDSFLEEIRRRGMLAGSNPEQAYFVICDSENNPSNLVDNGKMLVEVGVAPAVPGEFILLRLGRTEEEQPFVWE